MKNALVTHLGLTETELKVLECLEDARPESLRAFDQIPMRGVDLLCQVKLAAPDLAGAERRFRWRPRRYKPFVESPGKSRTCKTTSTHNSIGLR